MRRSEQSLLAEINSHGIKVGSRAWGKPSSTTSDIDFVVSKEFFDENHVDILDIFYNVTIGSGGKEGKGSKEYPMNNFRSIKFDTKLGPIKYNLIVYEQKWYNKFPKLVEFMKGIDSTTFGHEMLCNKKNRIVMFQIGIDMIKKEIEKEETVNKEPEFSDMFKNGWIPKNPGTEISLSTPRPSVNDFYQLYQQIFVPKDLAET